MPQPQPTAELLINIARCKGSSACNDIIKTQRLCDKEFQVPEPWRGDIAKAKLLFVSSNPSVNHKDDSPTASCPDEEIVAYFQKGFIPQFPKIAFKDGHISDHHVRFWASCRARAAELLNCKNVEIKPGMDFAMTEVVHCKSTGERGVTKAMPECISRHFEATMMAAEASVIVVLGKSALSAFKPYFPALETVPQHATWMGRNRHIVYLPHPNARGVKKKFQGYYQGRAEEYLSKLRAALR